jgi:transposase InsO family protein
MTYRKYDPMVKKLIIQSGNRNLFPELNIPRTTINYWLCESHEVLTSSENSFYESAIKKLEQSLFETKAKNYLVKECLEKIFKESEFYNYKSIKNRKFFVELAEEFKDILSLKEVLDVLGLAPSTYYRWKVELYGCKYNQLKKCPITRPTQLCREEQDLLIKYATSKQFRKFSTVSLVYYCKRKNLLNCSLESWYRYMKIYGIKRKVGKFKKKKYRNGIRAKRVNELWHIDITEIKFGEHEKAYLQLVVDNYSRMIVGWKVGKRKDMGLTSKTLLSSLNYAGSFQGRIMSDGGGENIGHLPQSLLLGRGIKQLIAKKDIRFSNSMVEAVFRQFKQKFLNNKPESFNGVYQLVYKFVQQYNFIIPHSNLGGATPDESYRGQFCSREFSQKVKAQYIEIKIQRRESYSKCGKCRKKFLGQQKLYA